MTTERASGRACPSQTRGCVGPFVARDADEPAELQVAAATATVGDDATHPRKATAAVALSAATAAHKRVRFEHVLRVVTRSARSGAFPAPVLTVSREARIHLSHFRAAEMTPVRSEASKDTRQ